MIQIFTNRSQNGSEAAPESGVIRWTIRDNPRAGTVMIAVADPGPPIQPDLLPRVTEPFVSTKASGTRLDLPIVSGLVCEQGGDLVITSNAAEGNRVALELPQATVAS